MDTRTLTDGVWSGDVDCNQCRIKDLVLFAHLTPDDFNHIHEPITDLAFPQSETIYAQGGMGDFIYTIRSGLVKLEVSQPDGGQKIVRLLTKGDVTGLETLIGERYHHTAVVLEACEVCKIPDAVIHRLQTHSATLCHDLMTRWDKSVFHADEWLAKLNTGPARQRVIQFIDYLISNSETEPEFVLPSGDDMSSILGLTRETVSRIIADLKREGHITFYGNGVYEGDASKLPGAKNT